MPTIPTLDGLTSQMVQTSRINTHVQSCGPSERPPSPHIEKATEFEAVFRSFLAG